MAINYKNIVKTIKDNLKDYSVDSTAAVFACTPIYAAIEIGTGLTPQTSLEARLKAAGVIYLGIGTAFAKIRDYSKHKTGIQNTASEWIKIGHDAAYNTIFNSIYMSLIYLSSGVDLEQLGKTLAGTAPTAALIGIQAGFILDNFRDLVGTKATQRPPKIFRRQSIKVKHYLAAAFVAASLAATGIVYEMPTIKKNITPHLEFILEKLNNVKLVK